MQEKTKKCRIKPEHQANPSSAMIAVIISQAMLCVNKKIFISIRSGKTCKYGWIYCFREVLSCVYISFYKLVCNWSLNLHSFYYLSITHLRGVCQLNFQCSNRWTMMNGSISVYAIGNMKIAPCDPNWNYALHVFTKWMTMQSNIFHSSLSTKKKEFCENLGLTSITWFWLEGRHRT